MHRIPLLVAVLLAVLSSPSLSAPGARAQSPATGELRPFPAPAFVPHVGQWSHDADFVAHLGATTIHLDEAGWSIGFHQEDGEGVALRMTLVDADTVELVGEQRLAGVHHYLRGPDREQWHRDVPRFASVRYVDIAPGIDVRMREHGGHFEYDLLLEPGAELSAVAIDVAGGEGLRIDGDGALCVDTAVGPVRMPAPLSWEETADGGRLPVDCHFRLLGPERFGFVAERRDPRHALVVDPGIVWSTFVGGSADEGMLEVEVGPSGDFTVACWTRSHDLPTDPGSFQQTPGGAEDTFIARFSADASTLLWSTYLGGDGVDWVQDMQVDVTGNCTLAGYTTSSNFPTTPGAYQTTSRGGWEAFVTRLDANGSALFSTLVGSAGDDRAAGLDVDANGMSTVTGRTSSASFPFTTGTFVGGDGGDSVVFRLDAQGANLVWAVPIGGSSREWSGDVAVDPVSGAVAFVGGTWSRDFPSTAGAYQTAYAGGRSDRFVARLDPIDGRVLHATLFGGTGEDGVLGGEIAWNPNGDIVIAGITDSTDFPTTSGVWDETHNGGLDAFVATLGPALSTLRWSTYLGGASRDDLRTMHVDTQGAITVGGNFQSRDYPVTAGAYRDGHFQVGVSQLRPDGAALIHSTAFGFGTSLSLVDLDVHTPGIVTFVGSAGPGLPTTPGVYQPTPDANGEAYVVRFDLTPYGPPTATSIAPHRVRNQPGTTITVRGDNLQIVDSVTVSGVQAQPHLIRVLSNTQLEFGLPAGVPIGPGQPVVVTSSTGSASIALDVAGLHPPQLDVPPVVFDGLPTRYGLRGDRAWTGAIFVSPTTGPTVFPGIASLAIGNGVPDHLLLLAVVVLDTTGRGSASVTYPSTLTSGLQIHAQAVSFDAASPTFPFEVSNSGSSTVF